MEILLHAVMALVLVGLNVLYASTLIHILAACRLAWTKIAREDPFDKRLLRRIVLVHLVIVVVFATAVMGGFVWFRPAALPLEISMWLVLGSAALTARVCNIDTRIETYLTASKVTTTPSYRP